MRDRAFRLLALPSRFHFWGSLGIVLFVAWVISAQVTDRTRFADADLHQDVMERWGAPIQQPAPSVRYVSSGSLFQKLGKLPLDAQQITVEARMNYRKRGLVYFSGFDFDFRGSYRVENPEPHDIDLVFVFPVQSARSQVLLSDLTFHLDGEPVSIELAEGDDKLVWTGRLARGEQRSFEIRFKGRGLDAFSYVPDPALPVRNLELTIAIEGGSNYDYGAGVVPAARAGVEEGAVQLGWSYASLESGVPMGVILPSGAILRRRHRDDRAQGLGPLRAALRGAARPLAARATPAPLLRELPGRRGLRRSSSCCSPTSPHTSTSTWRMRSRAPRSVSCSRSTSSESSGAAGGPCCPPRCWRSWSCRRSRWCSRATRA